MPLASASRTFSQVGDDINGMEALWHASCEIPLEQQEQCLQGVGMAPARGAMGIQMSANRNILVAVDGSEASDRAVDGGLSDGKR